MKKIILQIGVFFTLAMIILPIIHVLAADNSGGVYTVLAPLPGTLLTGPSQGGGGITDLQTYIPGLFKLLIGVAAVWAVLMIVIGGFQYMSSDAIFKKEEGKKRIMNAIYGLVLVIAAWLILYTINPNLLHINLNIDNVTVAAPAGGTLSTSGLQTTTTSALNALTASCQGCVNVTSTTEGSHDVNSAHYQGLAVDMAANTQLTNYITGSTNTPSDCQRITKTIGGQSATFLWESKGSTCGGTVASTGDHWHMSVPQ